MVSLRTSRLALGTRPFHTRPRAQVVAHWRNGKLTYAWVLRQRPPEPTLGDERDPYDLVEIADAGQDLVVAAGDSAFSMLMINDAVQY